MTSSIDIEHNPPQTLKWAAIGFGTLIVLAVAGYLAYTRLNYTVLYQGLQPEDAAAIVEMLEGQEVRYRLQNQGRDILVPDTKANAVKLSIIGADAPHKSVVGFELFNDSQMGLTDFAQKIKYQRAIQGELARTLMLMDGIDNARVHVAIPERALFRATENEPKAAVTILASKTSKLEPDHIIGIQNLVAASIPKLKTSGVVVLDANGEIISAPVILPGLEDTPAEINDKLPQTDQPALIVDDADMTADLEPVHRNEVGRTTQPPYSKPISLSNPQDAVPAVQTRPFLSYTIFIYGLIGLLLLVATIMVARKRRAYLLSADDHLNFAEQLRLRIEAQEEHADA